MAAEIRKARRHDVRPNAAELRSRIAPSGGVAVIGWTPKFIGDAVAFRRRRRRI